MQQFQLADQEKEQEVELLLKIFKSKMDLKAQEERLSDYCFLSKKCIYVSIVKSIDQFKASFGREHY